MPTRVVAVSNHKGGVGKTNVSVHVAAALGEQGKRVLLVDLDPSANATSHLGMPGNLAGVHEVALGLAEPLELVLSHDVVREGLPALPRGVDLLPSSAALEKLRERLDAREDGDFAAPVDCLRAPFRALRAADRWDWIVCDTGPGRTLPTSAAYLVVDWLLAVVKPELPSAQALTRVLRDIRAVAAREHLNPRLRLLGVVMSQVNTAQRLARMMPETFAETLRLEGYGEGYLLAVPRVPQRQEFANAWAARQTLFQYAPRSEVLDDVRELARWMDWQVDLLRELARNRAEHAPEPRTGEETAAAPAHAAPRPKRGAVL